MVLLTYSMIARAEHFYVSINRAYMAIVMAASGVYERGGGSCCELGVAAGDHGVGVGGAYWLARDVPAESWSGTPGASPG